MRFESERALRDAIERILAPLGRRVDEFSPMADARLADGSRVNVIIPPLSVDGPALSIRRFEAGPSRSGRARRLRHPHRGASRPARQPRFAQRRSVLISGGTGSGKTTLLNALSAYIDPAERVVTIEDAAELRLRQPHVVRLESRPASVEGRGEVTIRDLLRNAFRMRPDRIVIGEVRGIEALDLLTALNTGHDGALSTVHANSPEDALRRIETLALMAGDRPAARGGPRAGPRGGSSSSSTSRERPTARGKWCRPARWCRRPAASASGRPGRGERRHPWDAGAPCGRGWRHGRRRRS